jgi:hypothetical protein
LLRTCIQSRGVLPSNTSQYLKNIYSTNLGAILKILQNIICGKMKLIYKLLAYLFPPSFASSLFGRLFNQNDYVLFLAF